MSITGDMFLALSIPRGCDLESCLVRLIFEGPGGGREKLQESNALQRSDHMKYVSALKMLERQNIGSVQSWMALPTEALCKLIREQRTQCQCKSLRRFSQGFEL